MPKYKSKRFLELFKTFKRLFDTEGDVYESVKDSIFDKEYEHSMIPGDMEQKIILAILKDAAVEFYKENVVVLTEKQYLENV